MAKNQASKGPSAQDRSRARFLTLLKLDLLRKVQALLPAQT